MPKAGRTGAEKEHGVAVGVMLNSLDLEGSPQATRVVVAMSGGVDSSVTAALLKAEGYDVIGVTLQLYDHGAATHRKGACCAGQDIHDARAVAERIGIPHYVLDYEHRFKEAVIDGFADSYLAGETPVPCVQCNQLIKFRDLLTTAQELGAKALATGHYVASRTLPAGGRALYRARDPERDQSYFLFATTREQLNGLRFPLGERSKAETRELARQYGLAVADKHDSQDICFVPTGRYTEVIERLRPGAAEPGDIVDLNGKVLGRHEGIIRFTVGQRRGLGVSAGHPLYVVRLAECGCVTSTGSARAALSRRSAPAGTRCSCGCARPARRGRPGSAVARTASRSISSPAKMVCRQGRPACSTMRLTGRRACWAVGSSRRRRHCRSPRRHTKPRAPVVSSDSSAQGTERAHRGFDERGDGGRNRQFDRGQGLCALGAGL